MTTLTMKEDKRLEVIQRVFRGELTVAKAALVLGVSDRQCYRIKARVTRKGARGVVHGNRGRASKRKVKEKTLKRIVELAKGKYRGFNDHHLTEKLMEYEGIELSREKVRRTLRACGILSPRKKRAPKHRSRRERRAAEGMMLQVDGSAHDWLEGRGPRLCLLGGIDDASGRVPKAFFEPAESSWAYFRLFSEIFKTHGLPQSVYADRHSIFWTDRQPTMEEQLVNKRPTTEVGRGLEELGVTLIPAGSPQAKGRIERLWGTFQDRLVSELRLAGAKTLEQAQAVLDRVLADHNRKFAKPAASSQPAWRKATATQIEPCALSSSVLWPRTTPSPLGELPFESPRNLPIAPTPTRESMYVLLDGAVEFFYQKEKVARIQKRLTHLAYIERTASGRGSAMDPLRGIRTDPLALVGYPDRLTLPDRNKLAK